MTVFKTFIVPFDFSELGLAALKFAADWCERVGGKLIVAHGMALPLISTTSPAYDERDVLQGLRGHLEGRISSLLADHGWKGEVVVRPQAVHEWIDELTQDTTHPLIVLSRHGWSGKRKGLGGTARRIIQASQAPTWLLAFEPQKSMNCLVTIALDGKGGKQAELGCRLAAEAGAKVRIVTVVDTVADVGYLGEIGWAATERDLEHFTRLACDEIERVGREIDNESPPPGKVLVGGLLHCIEKEIADFDAGVVLCGKHTRGVLATLFLGSTTDMFARTLAPHILIVP